MSNYALISALFTGLFFLSIVMPVDAIETDGNGSRKIQKDVNGSSISLPYKLGSKTNDVEAGRNLKINIYTPSTLRSGEKYGCLILVEPKSGSHNYMQSFIGAAEDNEMILVSLPKIKFNRTAPDKETRKNWPKNKAYVDEAALSTYVKSPIARLHKDFSIDTKRIYLAGFEETTFVALWAMDKVNAAGCIAVNGGGKGSYTVSNRDALVMLCSPGSKQRWDVASTFERSASSSRAYLRFSQGRKSREFSSELGESLLMINAIFLFKHQKGTHEQIAIRFEKLWMEHLEAQLNNPEVLSLWLDFTSRFSLIDPAHKTHLSVLKREVLKDHSAVKALNGHKDTLRTLLRYFSGGWAKKNTENGKSSISKSVMRMKEKYTGTMWESVLNDLANPAR